MPAEPNDAFLQYLLNSHAGVTESLERLITRRDEIANVLSRYRAHLADLNKAKVTQVRIDVGN